MNSLKELATPKNGFKLLSQILWGILVLIFLYASTLLQGCGSDEPDCSNSPLLGTWTIGESRISFSKTCSWYDSVCMSAGTYTNTEGITDITLESGGVAGCLPSGNYFCLYSIVNGSELSYECISQND